MVTRVDNLESKLKGKFKGVAPTLTETKEHSDEYYEDPLKKKPKKGK